MKIQNPFYLALSLLLAGSVAVADHNGWSLVRSVARQTWQRSYPNTQHK